MTKDELDSLRTRLFPKYSIQEAVELTGISRSTLSRFKKGTHEPSPVVLEELKRLVGTAPSGGLRRLYQLMAKEMGQADGEEARILAEFKSRYTYFRYIKREENTPVEYIRGWYYIFPSKDGAGVPEFHHWSYDAVKGNEIPADDDAPQHRGYVFRVDGKVFFMSRGEGVLRLAIAVQSEDGWPWRGLVESLRTLRPHSPFAARFAMIADDNEEWMGKFWLSKEREANFRTWMGEPKNPDSGSAFFMVP